MRNMQEKKLNFIPAFSSVGLLLEIPVSLDFTRGIQRVCVLVLCCRCFHNIRIWFEIVQ